MKSGECVYMRTRRLGCWNTNEEKVFEKGKFDNMFVFLWDQVVLESLNENCDPKLVIKEEFNAGNRV